MPQLWKFSTIQYIKSAEILFPHSLYIASYQLIVNNDKGKDKSGTVFALSIYR